MEDWHGMIEADQDFQEEDVWGFVSREREESNHHKVNKHHNYKMKNKTSSSCCHDGARMIPRCNESHQQQLQSSAPMGIPDWSKIYKEKSQSQSNEDEDEDDEDDGGKIVPPHEYIARRSHITPSSMCEGVGRTLKGRDLSKLRNAILTKTGFLE
ncbi:hypothetical protein QVD17_17879 [Tagetes erecta]|uniref:Senescence regulator n=1 Tax=Tagetes erecta TaxID=13708 RepID=A0AAD8KGH8_TARER|nr:hypothetical protein QVD17_17879 [Tagetes erecta]